jgi:hypothetical protein
VCEILCERYYAVRTRTVSVSWGMQSTDIKARGCREMKASDIDSEVLIGCLIDMQ